MTACLQTKHAHTVLATGHKAALLIGAELDGLDVVVADVLGHNLRLHYMLVGVCRSVSAHQGSIPVIETEGMHAAGMEFTRTLRISGQDTLAVEAAAGDSVPSLCNANWCVLCCLLHLCVQQKFRDKGLTTEGG